MTDTHALDTPIWNSLSTRYSHLAIGGELAKRFPPEIGPFAAVSEYSAANIDALNEIVFSGEQVFMVAPKLGLFQGWEVVKEQLISQMLFSGTVLEASEGSGIQLLQENDVPKMLELIELVYPTYFRSGTARLNDHFGIWDEDRLVAMAGVRMSMPGFQEISAVCTHPDYRSRGYARRLVQKLIEQISARGDQPFLHTEEGNEVAQRLYESMGFAVRTRFPVVALRRR